MELTEVEKEAAWKIVLWLEGPCSHNFKYAHKRQCQLCMNELIAKLRKERKHE